MREVGETEPVPQKLPVQAELVSRAGPGAQRRHVGLIGRPQKPVAVAQEHLRVRQQVVREQHGLGALQVRVGGNDHLEVSFRGACQGVDQADQVGGHRTGPGTQVQSQVRGDLLVAAAPGVKLGGRPARGLGQQRLHVHVDVLEFLGKLEPSFGDAGPHGFQSVGHGARLLGRHQSTVLERLDPGAAPVDVLVQQAPVESDAGVEGPETRVHRRREPRGPHHPPPSVTQTDSERERPPTAVIVVPWLPGAASSSRIACLARPSIR